MRQFNVTETALIVERMLPEYMPAAFFFAFMEVAAISFCGWAFRFEKNCDKFELSHMKFIVLISFVTLFAATPAFSQALPDPDPNPRSPNIVFDRTKQLYKVLVKKEGREILMVYNLSQNINQIRERVNATTLPKRLQSQIGAHTEWRSARMYSFVQNNGQSGYVLDCPDKDIYFNKKGTLLK